MEYYFNDSLRLQLFWATPNLCASVLLLFFFLLLALFYYLKAIEQKICRWLVWVSFFCLILAEILIAMTYSRGGFVALLVGLFFFWSFKRGNFPIFLAIMFFVIFVFLPHGWSRVESIGNTADGSIFNRFLIWKGGLCILADHWLTGTGTVRLGEIYTTWFQPLWLDERYSTMVCDILTIGAAYGIITLWGYLTAVFILLWLSIKAWRTTRKIIFLAMGAGTASYMISSCFSTLYSHCSVSIPFIIFAVTMLTLLVLEYRHSHLSVEKKDIVIPCFSVAIFCSMLLIFGIFLRMSVPWRYQYIVSNHQSSEDLGGIWHAVPLGPSQAIVIYFHDEESVGDRELFRNMLRSLLAAHYSVWAVQVDSGFSGLERAQQLLQYVKTNNGPTNPVFLLGTENGGKHAILVSVGLANTCIKGVIAIDAPLEWPFDELSPIKHMAALKCPLLLIETSQENIDYGVKRIEKIRKTTVADVKLENISGMTALYNQKYDFAFQRIDLFIRYWLAKR